ncbi:MAG TPA: glycosyltransferase, partial [Lysobacter sp.]|nr:glycosyltransferase [Lysobacter sp.]
MENLERGGLERVVIDLAIVQREAGHDCRVICLFERGALADELVKQGIDVHTCGKRRGLDLTALRRLRSLLRNDPRSVLHTHNAVANYHAVLASAGLRIPRIVNTRHGMGSLDPRSRRERLYRWSMPRTHAVAAVCDAARGHFLRHGVEPRSGLHVVRNGIRVERFTAASASQRERLASELGFPPGTRLLGTVGRLNPVKDQASLIRAFRRLHDEVPAVGLVLIGDGDLRNELEACASEQGVTSLVRFLGDRGDVHRLLPGFHVFVLPSRSEGYSIALLEASAAA